MGESAPVRALVALPFLALLGLAARQDRARPAIELELVYLANEGFLARSGEHELLIDAFVNEPYSGYAAVPAELRAAMLAGKPPFDGVELALASHYHRDHFQAEAAAEFLRAHPETKFLSSPQVAEHLLAELEKHEDKSPSARIDALLPETGRAEEAKQEDTRIELIRLPHSGGAGTAGVQNLGHVLDLGGARLLHVGDADALDPAVDHYDLEKRAIDVALVPYWWLGDVEGVALARKLTGAKHLVAVHVPPAELATVAAQLASLDPSILLFERAGQSRKLTLGR
jgi:L-ascorbate metabolism protein UlaG (beta-lactamase superfamily)